MKILSIVFLIVLGYTACAQKSFFVRVYDLAGKKIAKGNVVAVTDTSLQLEAKKTPLNIPVQRIGFIKTKRSAGNNVLVGGLIGATAGAVSGVIAADPDDFLAFSETEGAIGGTLVGFTVGAAIGGLTILAKNQQTYLINGDLLKWKAF